MLTQGKRIAVRTSSSLMEWKIANTFVRWSTTIRKYVSQGSWPRDFAISATVSRAQAMVKKNPADRSPIELADAFARNARRRIDERFAAVFDNEDVLNYAIAQQTTAGKFAWVESGMVREK